MLTGAEVRIEHFPLVPGLRFVAGGASAPLEVRIEHSPMAPVQRRATSRDRAPPGAIIEHVLVAPALGCVLIFFYHLKHQAPEYQKIVFFKPAVTNG